MTLGAAHAATPAPSAAPLQLSVAGQAPVTLAHLRTLPPDTPVRTAGGRVVTAKQMIALTDAIRSASSRPRVASETGFSHPQGPAATELSRGAYLPAVLNRPGSDVVQLPNGAKLTVSDLHRLDAVMQRWKGHGIVQAQPSRPNLAGPAVVVHDAHELQALQGKPDSTVLENAKGVRVTLGELRAQAKATAVPKRAR
ncbi:hypothetical protein DZC73_05525 [Albitalea terrae]|uniref:Uncharacterized protein n=1 Tax=Piscinibacter terrae TaxID=2496871 RepID=A0A3N7HVY4_9BURK|nr:hypothetical protein DZC73_05525 [Albitalea terrae]